MSEDDDGSAAHRQLLRDFAATFANGDGARVLAHLRKRFAANTFVSGQPTESHARSAQAAVVVYIESRVAEAERYMKGAGDR